MTRCFLVGLEGDRARLVFVLLFGLIFLQGIRTDTHFPCLVAFRYLAQVCPGLSLVSASGLRFITCRFGPGRRPRW